MQADSSVLIDRELNICFSPTRDRIAPLFTRCTYILYADRTRWFEWVSRCLNTMVRVTRGILRVIKNNTRPIHRGRIRVSVSKLRVLCCIVAQEGLKWKFFSECSIQPSCWHGLFYNPVTNPSPSRRKREIYARTIISDRASHLPTNLIALYQ